MQVTADGRQGHGDDRHVEHDHELRHARHREDHPVGSMTSLGDEPSYRPASGMGWRFLGHSQPPNR